MPDVKGPGQLKKIRSWLGDNPEGDLREVYAVFGGPEMRETLKALDYLAGRRELHLSRSFYRYGRKHGNEARESKQTAIYSVLRNLAKVCRVVQLDEVIRLAEAEASYVRRYIRFLEDLGFVQRRASGVAVLDKAMKQAGAPRFNQRRPAGGADE